MLKIKTIQCILGCGWLCLSCLRTNVYSRMEIVRRESPLKELNIRNREMGNFTGFVRDQRQSNKPWRNFTEEFAPSNTTQGLLDFYREMTALKNGSVAPLRDAYIYGVLIPKTDAKVEKLRAETAYIETKNAAKRKRLGLVREDFEKSTPFTSMANRLFESQANTNQVLGSIYNETFYYLNNKNITNSTRVPSPEFS